MKTTVKTIILMIVIIVGLVIGLKIYNKSHVSSENAPREDLALDDPIVTDLMGRIYKSNLYRDAKFSVDKIDNLFVIQYTIDTLTKKDYSIKVVQHKKSLCEVTSKILFTSTSNCTIRIIKNDVFKNKIKNDFNVDMNIKYDNFEYKGYFCKNDGKRYYCFMRKYVENIKNFSVLKEAYKEDNKIIIYEYYYFIDLNDKDSCYLYLNKDYCDKKNVNTPIEIEDDIIKKSGVLYRHEYEIVDDKYFFLQSFIVSER